MGQVVHETHHSRTTSRKSSRVPHAAVSDGPTLPCQPKAHLLQAELTEDDSLQAELTYDDSLQAELITMNQ